MASEIEAQIQGVGTAVRSQMLFDEQLAELSAKQRENGFAGKMLPWVQSAHQPVVHEYELRQ